MKKLRLFLGILFVAGVHSVAVASRPIRGFYEVPVSDEMKPYARYPIKFKADKYQVEPNKISFPLPEALVGHPMQIEMSRVNVNSNEWQGVNVDGTCTQESRYLVCKVRFKDLKIDSEGVKAIVDAKYVKAEEIDGRMAVAKTFSTEPIGILNYKLRGGSAEDFFF
jgi:hypothetical protein